MTSQEKIMWQTITGVNFSQLDSWLKSISGEDGQVCLPFELNDVSPVDGLKVTDFKAVEKKLAKLRMNKIPSSTVMMHMTEQIRNQYGQRKNQEFDQVLLLKENQAYIQFEVKSTRSKDRLKEMYDGAERQLKLGGELFKKVFAPLASLPESWKHYGFKVFPEVENRKVFAELEYQEEELKTILTKEEIEDSGLKWLVELDLQSSKKETIDSEYKNIISL